MNTDTFDAALTNLLRAFRTHEDHRRGRADIPTLARSNHELYQARMAAYHASL
jgi:hypothetical protein